MLMTAVRIDVGRQFVMWIVAGLSSCELALGAIAAALKTEWSDLFVFGFGSVGVFFAAASLEKLKLLGRE